MRCFLPFLVLLGLLACGGDQELFDQARHQRAELIHQLEQEISELPELTKEAETLEKELDQLLNSSGKEAPQVPEAELEEPEFATLSPLENGRLDEFQRSELNEMDAQIQRLQDQLPRLKERRAQVARLEAQLQRLRSEP